MCFHKNKLRENRKNMKQFFLILIFLFAMQSVNAQETFDITYYKTPKSAGSLLFYDKNNDPVTLRDFKGHVVLLNVWGTWCTPCLHEMPTLDALQRRYKKAGLKVLPVSLDQEDLYKIPQFYRAANIRYLPVYYDFDRAIARLLNTPKLPTTYLINKKGLVIAELVGAEDWFSDAARAIVEKELKKDQKQSVSDDMPPQIYDVNTGL